MRRPGSREPCQAMGQADEVMLTEAVPFSQGFVYVNSASRRSLQRLISTIIPKTP